MERREEFELHYLHFKGKKNLNLHSYLQFSKDLGPQWVTLGEGRVCDQLGETGLSDEMRPSPDAAACEGQELIRRDRRGLGEIQSCPRRA